MKKTLGILILLLILAVAVAGLLLFTPPFEKRPPQIQVPPAGSYITSKTSFTVTLEDKPTGLKKAQITLTQDGKNWSLYTGSFPFGTYSSTIPLVIEPGKLGLKEGPAILSVNATDRSLWHLGKGNTATVKTQLTVDCTPPTVELLDNTRYIYEKGSGAAVFTTSEDAVRAGVQVGSIFFKAYPRRSKKQVLWAVLFGIPPYAAAKKARLTAEDGAGNIRTVPLPFHLLPQKVKRETFHISDTFIQDKIYPLLPSEDRSLSPTQAFKKVNEELRRHYEERLHQLAAQSSGPPLWKGPFVQLGSSKVTATFGDQRTYISKGKVVSHSVHLGYDLASVAHAPVPAGNSGRILFTGFVGIYGNVILIDHGMGLTTLYAHLSRATVKYGQQVNKGQIIGYTDSTGLAGGDHLHYGTLLSGHPVNPKEWWDGKWLIERIMTVLKPYLQGEKVVQTNSGR